MTDITPSRAAPVGHSLIKPLLSLSLFSGEKRQVMRLQAMPKQFGQDLRALSRCFPGLALPGIADSLCWAHGGCGWCIASSRATIQPSIVFSLPRRWDGVGCVPTSYACLGSPWDSGGTRVQQPRGWFLLSPQAQPLASSPGCLMGHPQLCFCWQRGTERISDVSCASLGGFQGMTAGEPTSPSALAEEAYSGLEGQPDSRGAPWGRSLPWGFAWGLKIMLKFYLSSHG